MLVSLPSLSTIAENNMARQIRKKWRCIGASMYHLFLLSDEQSYTPSST